jgi:peptide/nickel transport system substrate-binding protein
MKIKLEGLFFCIILLILTTTSCDQQLLETQQDIDTSENNPRVENNKNEEGSAEGDECPAVTIDDRKGVEAGIYERLYELEEYELAAVCEMEFKENPDIAELNNRITNNPDLPAVEERLPAEPLVVVPYHSIGKYGGQFNVLSLSAEAGTSDYTSARHVNLVRFNDDILTIEPNVAKNWAWNDDFTELTFHLREGHKWSDGQPFTSADVKFWMNELILNPEVYPEVPSWAVFGDDTIKVEIIDDTSFKFVLPSPVPGILGYFATVYIQPWQPKHFFDKKIEEGMTLPEVAEMYYGNSDWKDVPSPLLSGEADDVLPTLESHILVEETSEGRNVVANPYFFMVDTVGNQLPYINEHDESYAPDLELRNLKITNGEVDFISQSINIFDYPLYKENEENGNYTADLRYGLGQTVFYAFNLNHPDEELSRIFNDLGFRQAMSLAINRDEIAELIYLGQAEPMQFTPIDPNTVDFITNEQKTAFIEYDPGRANALLDKMGLVDVDSDGFRDRLDGEKFTLDLQFSNQGGPPAIHELVKDYWEDIGVSTRIKEVTSDEYRERANANQAEVLTFIGQGTYGVRVVMDPYMLLPPFGSVWNPGGAFGWAEWVNSAGASGIEPPEDVLELYETVSEFLMHELGSPDSSQLGRIIIDVHVDNLWKIGIAGNIQTPVINHNRLGNYRLPKVVSGGYRRTYPMIPAQWFINE